LLEANIKHHIRNFEGQEDWGWPSRDIEHVQIIGDYSLTELVTADADYEYLHETTSVQDTSIASYVKMMGRRK
jgi:hypothetical protein